MSCFDLRVPSPAQLRLLRNQSLRGEVQPMRQVRRLHRCPVSPILPLLAGEWRLVCEAELEFGAAASEWKIHPISKANVKKIIVMKLSQSCHRVVTKLSHSCHEIKQNQSKACGILQQMRESLARALRSLVAVVRGEKSHVGTLPAMLVGDCFARRRRRRLRDFPLVLVRVVVHGR